MKNMFQVKTSNVLNVRKLSGEQRDLYIKYSKYPTHQLIDINYNLLAEAFKYSTRAEWYFHYHRKLNVELSPHVMDLMELTKTNFEIFKQQLNSEEIKLATAILNKRAQRKGISVTELVNKNIRHDLPYYFLKTVLTNEEHATIYNKYFKLCTENKKVGYNK